MKRTILMLAAAGFLAAGCATDPVTGEQISGRTTNGALIGAGIGAVGGLLAGGNKGRNALVGAAVGGAIGGGIGRYMDQQEADMRKAVAGTGIGVQRVGDQIMLVMPSDVTFSKGSASLDAQFTPVLDQVAKSLNLYPKTMIDIVGHASSEGSAQVNQNLSEQRAISVSTYLQGRGVINQRIQAYGRGASQLLISPERSEADRAKNRRVVVTLVPVTEG